MEMTNKNPFRNDDGQIIQERKVVGLGVGAFILAILFFKIGKPNLGQMWVFNRLEVLLLITCSILAVYTLISTISLRKTDKTGYTVLAIVLAIISLIPLIAKSAIYVVTLLEIVIGILLLWIVLKIGSFISKIFPDDNSNNNTINNPRYENMDYDRALNNKKEKLYKYKVKITYKNKWDKTSEDTVIVTTNDKYADIKGLAWQQLKMEKGNDVGSNSWWPSYSIDRIPD